ncbi:alpha/beta hydrolase [Palleronia sp. KMU-117]|uniref:alpha/beta hydrolase n=1 Tax=Palleronia sp. KMU-117 TaxID=3434108 RepID=UPI003D76226E
MKNDLAYTNSDFIPDGASYPDRWATLARDRREVEAAIGRARLNDPYGPGERQKMDIFHPAGRAEGLVVFVHGGYWMRFDRSFWSHLAHGATARGWAVAMPSYTLAPDARIPAMTREIAQAVAHAASRVGGPIRLTGHSAGGHLVARMLCPDVPLPPEALGRLARVMPISPVADLRPLLETSMNATLGLDADEAARESPALCLAPREVPVTVWVGADERPAFVEQARWLAKAWPHADLVIEDGRHHFDVIDGLANPDSEMIARLLG